MTTHKQSGIIKMAVVAVVIAGASFWGGMAYAGTKAPAGRPGQGNFPGGQFSGRPGGAGRGAGALGAAFGTIVAKDANSITVQLGGPNATSTNGNATGSRIVLISGSTQVGKFVTGTLGDLSVGEMITVNGTPNSDGSITASMVQIRPASSGPRGGQ